MKVDVVDEAFIFLFGPSSFVCVLLLATRSSSHLISFFALLLSERERERERVEEEEERVRSICMGDDGKEPGK